MSKVAKSHRDVRQGIACPDFDIIGPSHTNHASNCRLEDLQFNLLRWADQTTTSYAIHVLHRMQHRDATILPATDTLYTRIASLPAILVTACMGYVDPEQRIAAQLTRKATYLVRAPPIGAVLGMICKISSFRATELSEDAVVDFSRSAEKERL